MSDKNVVILEGRLTKEPFLPTGQTGEYSVLKFTIACNKSVKNQDGTYADKADFFDCQYWTKKPQHWLQQLQKGTHILIEARSEQGFAKEGENNYGKVVFNIQQYPIVIGQPKQQAPSVTPEVVDEEIPF